MDRSTVVAEADERPHRDVPAEAAPGGLPELSDARLVELLAAGRGDALEVLHGRYARRCLALASRLLVDERLAQEVVQDVFLALWRNPGRYDPGRGVLVSWLLAVTHHRAVDLVRREQSIRSRRVDLAAADDRSDDTDVAEDVATRLQRERVRSALGTLPLAQREALVMAYFGAYTQREVSQLTGVPLGTVKTRTLAGLRRLRDALQEVLADDDVTAWGAGR
jgi:RNA polymerase sigma factor (sigma-70 family)